MKSHNHAITQSKPHFGPLIFWLVCLTMVSVSSANAQIFLFADDYSLGNVYSLSSTGVVSSYASGLNSPTGLAVDNSGDLFIANPTNGTIQEITPHAFGTSSTPYTSTFATGLTGAKYLAFDSSGNLYVSIDSGSGSIVRITPGGSTSTYVSGLNQPVGLVFDASGNIYVADQNGSQSSYGVSKITPNVGGLTGTATLFSSGSNLSAPVGLAFNLSGTAFGTTNLYAGTSSGVVQISSSGTPSAFSTGTPTTGNAIGFSSSGQLFVTDNENGNIYTVAANGNATKFNASFINGNTGLAFADDVPEPSSWALALVGIAGLGLWRRFRALV